jgi:hypothetical protein
VVNEQPLSESDPAAEARSRTMHELLLAGLHRGERATRGVSRLAGEPQRDEQGGSTDTPQDSGGFDGGVQRRSVPGPAGGWPQQTANQPFAEALSASRRERAERGDEDALIARNT